MLIFVVLANSFAPAQGIQINEFSSLNTNYFDEDNDTPDWFEIYNSGNKAVDLANYCMSDDFSNLTKWAFPSFNLPPETYLLVFASGKDRSAFSYYKNLINWGDTFSYTIGSSDILQDWKSKEFNDQQWSAGPSGFGFGDNDDATIIQNGAISVYIRRVFQISDMQSIKKLLLHMDYDDGFVAYINGIEVARANLGLPNSAVSYDQLADDYIEPLIMNGITPELFTIPDVSNILTNGDNVLAIEIHNQSPTSSDLTLIPFLSAEYNTPASGNMPEILGMRGSFLHTNFKLAAEGEVLYLSNINGVILDQTDSVNVPSGLSYGRTMANTQKWAFFSEPTPGLANTSKHYDEINEGKVLFSKTGGKYPNTQNISISSPISGNIYYTIDGSNPTLQSTKYTSPIKIEYTTVLKAMVLSDRVLTLNPSVETYVISSRKIDLPIVSISSHPDNFFDWNTGILVDGPNWQSRDPHFGANYWEDWERPVFVEYFNKESKKVYSAPAGVKVFGAWSRANDQKSLALFAREPYGVTSFKYPFFNDRNLNSYKSLVLRNSGNDCAITHMRDAMMTGLVRNVDIERQAYQPTVVLINGEYWGILNMREKINEDFLAQHHSGVESNKVDILEANADVVEGSNLQYNEMLSYIRDHSLVNQEDYNHIAKQLDIDNFMDYQIAQIYFDNTDWPGNNIKFWRAQAENGRWRWILYDTDFGFGIGFGSIGSGYGINTLAFALAANGPSWPNPPWSTFLLRSLVRNTTFRREFVNRFADRLNHDFESNNVVDFIDSLRNNLINEVPYHQSRWGNLWNFDSDVDDMITFAERRPEYMRNFLVKQFSLGKVVELTVNVSDKRQGKVQVNTLHLIDYPWKGKYFDDNPLPITAIAEPGYKFSHWEGYDSDSEHLWVDIPSGGFNITAVFEPFNTEYNAIVINEINYSSTDTENADDWIELYNTTRAVIDISGWELKDNNDTSSFILPKGSVIKPHGYLILCRDIKKFTKIYTTLQNTVGDFDFGLSAVNDVVRLYNNTGVLIDSVPYFNENPWPEVDAGKTISLYTPFSNNAIGASWLSSEGAGTPGVINEYFVGLPSEPLEIKESIELLCYPNPMSQNTVVTWKNTKKQNISIKIYNIQGECIQNIVDADCPIGDFEKNIRINSNSGSGIYLVKLIGSLGITKTIKLVKI